MLRLEAFSARHGDALLLHYGTKDKPMLAMIDGGPPGVYNKVIAPRLAELGTIPRIRWAYVSHVDDDHIMGLITLFKKIKDAAAPPASVDALFHNIPTADDALGVQPAAAGGGAAPSERDRLGRELAELIAPTAALRVRTESFQQGADLANLAREIHVARNPPTGKRLLTGDSLPATHVAPLAVTVVAPSLERFRKLIDEWRDELGVSGGVLTASTKKKLDDSVTNLSSLVLLVQQGTKKILLTGDALAGHTIEGLEELGLLTKGGGGKPLAVDVLKLPHHGSDSTTDLADEGPGLLERVRAKHYVISADGRFDNPSEGILRRLVRAQGKRKATVWLTTAEGQGGTFAPVYEAALAALRDEIALLGANVTVKVPAAGQRSVVVPLEA